MLNTLIEDIYAAIEPLCDGQHIEVSDELIDEFGEAVKEAFKSWARPTPRDANFNLRISNIGKPARKLWFEKNRESNEFKGQPATMIKFLYGHLLEELVLLFVRMSGHTVTDEQKEVTVEDIKGHMDCKIDGEVVDIKTASSFAFAKFKYGTLAEDDSFGYLTQLAGYEAAEKTNAGGFLAINKESGELALYIPEDLEKPNVVSTISKLKSEIDLEDMPARCHDPVPEGTKGNMKLHKNCNYCNFKEECYADANDGAGLRAFKYQKGIVYLTSVAQTPNVEEILA